MGPLDDEKPRKKRRIYEEALLVQVLAPRRGGGAARYAPYAAPAGWRWDFVTEGNERVTQNNEPVVDLVRAA